MNTKAEVLVIGGGLAGSEAAYYLASRGIKTTLWEMKPQKFSPAHHSPNFGELVCSNSLKSNDIYANACGLLKEEMRILGSMLIEAADKTSVPAGAALAVDRDKFSEYITKKLRSCPNLTIKNGECEQIPETSEEGGRYAIIATNTLAFRLVFRLDVKNDCVPVYAYRPRWYDFIPRKPDLALVGAAGVSFVCLFYGGRLQVFQKTAQTLFVGACNGRGVFDFL
jgi:hypothetical protein